MDIQALQGFVNSCGYPITMSLAMAWFIYTMYNKIVNSLNAITDTNKKLSEVIDVTVKNIESKVDKVDSKIDKVDDKVDIVKRDFDILKAKKDIE